MSNKPLSAFPVVVEIPVQWGEMDAYGHVNNTVIFRFFESARVAFLERCRFVAAYDELKIGGILHSTDCRFRQPLYYPDTVLVGARATEILGSVLNGAKHDSRRGYGYGRVVRLRSALEDEAAGDGDRRAGEVKRG